MENYIRFFYNTNDNYIAQIQKDGKNNLVYKKNEIKVLKELLAKEHKYLYNQEGTLKDVDKVISNFYKYKAIYNKMYKAFKPLRIFNQVDQKMKLSKKNMLIGKTVVASSLAAVIGITSISIVSANKSPDQPTFSNETTVSIEEINNDYEVSPTTVNIESDELVQMIEDNNDSIVEMNIQNENINEFHFSYEDRTGFNTLNKARRYEDIFEKYARIYGLDKEVLIAMGAQENYGEHYENLHNHGSTGIMRIEDINLNSDIRAYNFETGEVETFHITLDKIKDLDTNIKVGAMILRSKLDAFHNNLPLAIQSYNYGSGNVNKVINMCSQNEHISREEIEENPTYTGWMRYRSRAVRGQGDSEYLERIFSYLPNNYQINIKDRNGNDIQLTIVNDRVKTNQI